ncbi:XTP/dITP diphosphohydrolase [Actinoplanes lutulentus]|uniref:XTP/dITP diphosphohydrolase n=1 Tax=Actinoplanes lutulentus TaxID=1287878 RepID=A0A327ZNC8_9ACTN|nr:nucleoside triphosphate pyrophosphohydrolase [Actinoplanes lutulentus]MBB2945527.1 XTP/dITP diphosphohydrolase [Actinoplanes lutulentus]RAK40341.1 XTP/dITP diphosphohydrolase [Actinoplanes lutulentus]
MTSRILLLVTSPRLPAGLLTAEAWDAVRAYPVFAHAESEQAAALRVAGVEVTVLDTDAQGLLDAIGDGPGAVWLAGPTGDQTFARQLGLRLAREPGLAELELIYGSWDPPGARLLDAVTVMDRLVSPGGDPWKRAQTHQTLAPYLLEESYEAYDAIVSDDPEALREELGDVLLQVVLHARLAEEQPDGHGWSIDDVAGGLVEKMVRRNPHVFAGEQVQDIEEITANWERIKQAEKERESVLDGIALSQPALALAAKILHRVERGSLSVPLPEALDLGSSLLKVVADARAAGLDPEAELRRAALEYADAVRAAENVGPSE